MRLSDKYPCGLEWAETNSRHKDGDMAGYWKTSLKRYVVSICSELMYCHRIVYYMRTGEDPGDKDVLHLPDNPERDNRKELVLYQRTAVVPPKRRNNRKSNRQGV